MSPVLALFGLFPGGQGPQKLTIDDALALADRNAFAIQLSQSSLEKQRQISSQRAAGLGPTFGVSGTYLRYNEASTASFGNQRFVTQGIDSKSASATVNWALDLAGNAHRLLKASKAQVYAQAQTLAATRNETRQAIRTAYLAVLRAQAQVAVVQEALSSDTERVRSTKLQLDQGTVAKVDLLRAQTQQAQSQNDVLTANNQLALAKQSLNFALARPIETSIEVVDIAQIPNVSPDPMSLSSLAQKQRPDVRALEFTAVALEGIRRATEGTMNPSLNLGVTYTQNITPQGLGVRDQSVTGTLTLNIPVYDGNATRDAVKAARQDEAQSKIQLNQLKLNISLEVRQALTNYANAKSRLSVADDNVVTSKEALRLAELKRKEGIGTLQEVLDAQSALTQAENTAVGARYDALQAVADLQRALGSDQIPSSTSSAAGVPKNPSSKVNS
jgi:outer membrane protein TolC